MGLSEPLFACISAVILRACSGATAGVAVAGEIQRRRIVAAVDDVVVRRVGVDVGELVRILARPVLRHPEAGDEELVVADHVEQRIGADDRPEQIGPLVRHGADEQAGKGGFQCGI